MIHGVGNEPVFIKIDTKLTYDWRFRVPVQMTLNILYLGMGHDIITPIQLEPNFDILFVIDHFDTAYSPDETFNGQKDYIINSLLYGAGLPFYPDDVEDHGVLSDKATILSNCQETDSKWILTFELYGKIRQLIRFERDFTTVWPEEITRIRHIIGIGSFDWNNLIVWKDYFRGTDDECNGFPIDEPIYFGLRDCVCLQNLGKSVMMRTMVMSRSLLPLKWTALTGGHTNFPIRFIRKDVRLMPIRGGEKNVRDGFSQVVIHSFEDDWITKYAELR